MKENKYNQGRFHPKNPEKYKGDVKNIIYRSSWELYFMQYCDRKPSILEWGSEEFFIPYFDPTSNKVRRYFPDFYVKLEDRDKNIKKYVIEIKPKKQTAQPQRTKRKQNRTYLNEMLTYQKNIAKWKAAEEWCADHKFEFKIITEDNLSL